MWYKTKVYCYNGKGVPYKKLIVTPLNITHVLETRELLYSNDLDFCKLVTYYLSRFEFEVDCNKSLRKHYRYVLSIRHIYLFILGFILTPEDLFCFACNSTLLVV